MAVEIAIAFILIAEKTHAKHTDALEDKMASDFNFVPVEWSYC
jgi:hypothetical protein